jgi:mono/diheme cytochrome c family protein
LLRASSLVLALLLVACAASARDDVPAEIAARENPIVLEDDQVRFYKRHFKAKCARCHGLDGKGGGPEAAKQELPPRDLTDATYMTTRSDGQLFYQILMGGSDKSAMPAFGPESAQGWSEERVWYMVAFVRRFSEPAGD